MSGLGATKARTAVLFVCTGNICRSPTAEAVFRALVERAGLSEAIAIDFPSLTLEQIHGTIAFYLRHRAEIDHYLSEQDARWQQLQQESATRHGPLLQRIRLAASQRTPTGREP